MRREWPGKKQLASEQPAPQPNPSGKNRIQSVLVALPVIMLIVGLVFYFRGESAQNNGEPVLAELVSREGEFKTVSEVSGIGTAKHFLWYTVGDKTNGARITFEQVAKLNQLSKGDRLTLELAPRVAGSNVLWAYRIEQGDNVLVDVGAN